MRNKKIIMAKTSQKKEKKQIFISSLKEFKQKFLPKDIEQELYLIDDPKELGIEIAEKVYEKNKHLLFSR